AQRGVRAGVKATSQYVREDARDYLAGLTAEETAKLKASSIAVAGRYPSIDATTMHERLRDTSMAMRSVDKALEIGDVIAKGH
ncbi:hypothetical protein NL529_32215, partial [Klebsiella pneumoniae]|nr:hypothetical protein [Klebsiella pneumoniae]